MRTVPLKKLACIVLEILILSLSLCGCSEPLRESQRICKKAEQFAEERAVEYIREKYGIKATPHGYEMQTYTVGFSLYTESRVLVYMSYEDEKFTIGLDVDDESILSDNRQSPEICEVLMDYLSDKLTLPKPERFQIWFSITEVPSYRNGRWKSEYSSDNLVNFMFNNQTAEELLEYIDDIRYGCRYSDLPRSLETISLDPEDWPKREDFEITMRLFLRRDAEADNPYRLGYDPGPWSEWNLKEYLYTYIGYPKYEKLGKPDTGREFYSYQSTTLEGLTFITRLPYRPTEPYEPEYQIEVSDEDLVWKREYLMADKSTLIMEYDQVSMLFEAVDLSTTRCYTQIIISDEFAREFEGELYLGSFNKKTGQMIMDRIYRNGERRWEDEDVEELKSRIKGMGVGFQYALLIKTAEYAIPAPSGEVVS